jgi:hypothetical protein
MHPILTLPNTIKSLPGIIIALCFFALILLVIQHIHGKMNILNRKTITYISSDKSLLLLTKKLCFSVVFLTPIFLIFLGEKFHFKLNYPIVLLFTLSMIGLFFASVTLSHKNNPFHLLMAILFFASMLIIEIFVSYQAIKVNRFLGVFGMILALLAVIYSVFAFKDRFFSGFEEMILMGISAIWVIIFSTSIVF